MAEIVLARKDTSFPQKLSKTAGPAALALAPGEGVLEGEGAECASTRLQKTTELVARLRDQGRL